MSRAQVEVDHVAEQRLVDVALQRFAHDGYRRTSIRQIASDAGCSAGSFYEHFPSKQSILLEIIDTTYTAAVAETEAAVALAGDDLADQFEAAVWAQCDFYMRYQQPCRIAQAELPNLDQHDRERLEVKRLRLAEITSEIIREGAAAGEFDAVEPEVAGRAVSTMCGAIGSWYDPDGHEVPRQIAQSYCELAARLAGVKLSSSRKSRRLVAVPAQRSA
jgi:AcrR family transcriptional regulator